MTRTIWAVVRTSFQGIHHWPECPDGTHDHIQARHRHLFHVTATAEQRHDNRDLEFLELRDQLDRLIKERFPLHLGHKSCEMMAEEICGMLHELCGEDRRVKVEVSEDGENGAIVELWPR